MTEPTPPPWTNDGDGFISGPDGRLVAQVNPPDGPGYPENEEADADLIAGAHELRDALEDLLYDHKDLVDHKRDSDVVQNAEDALRKAGVEP